MYKKPNIAFFGTPDRAIIVLEVLKKSNLLPSLIVTQPDRHSGRNMTLSKPPVKVWGCRENIRVLQPENLSDKIFIEELKKANFDLFVIVAFGKIILQNILDIPKKGSLNLHASLLPRLRGSSPIETAILLDEKNTGVTIILMDSLMDHGPIIAQEALVLDKWPISVVELSEKLLNLGADLMVKTIPLWINDEIKAHEQDHTKSSVVKKIKKEDGLIDLKADPYKNYLKFLAYREWPTSYFFIEKSGKKLRVIIKDAFFENNQFIIKKVIPEGKKEILFEDFVKNYKFSI